MADGLKSGRFSRTGSFFTFHTGGKAILDHDGLRSGNFSQIQPTSELTRRVRLFLTTTALNPEDSAGQEASSHPTQEARLFFTMTALDPGIISRKWFQKDFLAKDTNFQDRQTERTPFQEF